MNPEYVIRLCATALLVALFGATAPAERFPVVHRHVGGDSDVLANAYLVERPDGVVGGGGDVLAKAYRVEPQNGVAAVDGTMRVAEGGRRRADLFDLHKPLLAIL